MADTIERSVTDFINRDYKEYSLYVLKNRAIPSAIDGLKPVQRKILYVSLRKARTELQKVSSIASLCASDASYHHGEAAAAAAVTNMAQAWSNNAPLLQGQGNFGSRLIQEAAASRYIYAKVHENFNKFFKHTELAPANIDPDYPEPQFYLPVIPWLLVNGIKGIAVGFATDIQPRSIKDIRAACLEYLESGHIKNKLLPSYPDFRGKVQLDEGRYVVTGSYEVKEGSRGTKILSITELPVGYDRESYINLLYKLQDSDVILNFDDACSGEGFRFDCYLNRQQWAKMQKKDPLKVFKLERHVSDNIVTIDEDNKVRVFETPQDVVKHFVDFRLGVYKSWLAYEIRKTEEETFFLLNKADFFRRVIDGKLSFKNKTKAEIIEACNYPTKHTEAFLTCPILSITKEKIEELEAEIDRLTKYADRLRKSDSRQLYIDDLKAIKP